MLECAVVGGGIHGTYLVQRLLEGTSLRRSEVAILDPGEELLESFRRKAEACAMTELRSTFVQHVGTEPFGLESFAEAHDREAELRPTPGYPRRPSLGLFLDYADYVIDGNDLAALHRRARVEAIRRAPEGMVLETDDGPVESRRCVLAIGHGGRYAWPAWAKGVAGIEHVWDGFDPDERAGHTVVVGGGVTAGQLAVELGASERTTVLSRHPFERAVTEAEPPWINWNHIERELLRHPPGSRARFETIREARNDATIPPHVFEPFEERIADGSVTVRFDEVERARAVDGTVRLAPTGGGCLRADRVVLATGFAPVFEHPFVRRVAETLGLERGHRGMAVLDDRTLAWRDRDGGRTPLFVTGALAAGTVGPLAGTVAGARRAADRIVPAVDDAVVAAPTPG